MLENVRKPMLEYYRLVRGLMEREPSSYFRCMCGALHQANYVNVCDRFRTDMITWLITIVEPLTAF